MHHRRAEDVPVSGHPAPGESTPNLLGLVESRDAGDTWTTLALSGQSDFHALDAVNAADPNMLAATTEAGVVLSRDGGRSFGDARQPVVVFVAWSVKGTIYGLGPDSTVHTSADGATWAKAGTVPGGRPQALAATHDGRVLAATAGGVYESRDGARTFIKLA